MLTFSRYLIGSLTLAASIGSLTVAARAVQLKFLGNWQGPEAMVVRFVAGISICVTISYLLGLVGLFSIVPLAILFIASGPVAQTLLKPATPSLRPERPMSALLGALLGLTAVMLAAVWMHDTVRSLETGLSGTDALWYHLPFAARFFQTGSLLGIDYAEPLFQTYFYPATGSIFHALGMVFYTRDWLSPLINLFWVGLCLLAGAAIGRPRNVAVPAAIAVAIPLATNALVAGSAGSAMVDVPSTFFFLAAIAILVQPEQDRATLFLAALATGLGLATKLTLGVPTAALTIGIFVLAKRGDRLRTLGIWLAGVAITGGFWFLRNLIAIGNPLPLFKVPGLPSPGDALESAQMVAISHYFTNRHIMLFGVPNAWDHGLGPMWQMIVILGVIGTVAVILKPGERVWRMVGAVTVVSAIGYFFTPGTAAGPIGGPLPGLVWDVRFVAPALTLSLALTAVWSGRLAVWKQNLLAIIFTVIVVVTVADSAGWLDTARLIQIEALRSAAVVVGLLALIGTRYSTLRRNGRIVALSALLLTFIFGGQWLEHDYAKARASSYNVYVAGPGKIRVGILGTAASFQQYQMYGPKLENRVISIGVRGPHGAFTTVRSCAEMVEQINSGNFDYVVTSPNRNIWIRKTNPAPEGKWLGAFPNVRQTGTMPGLYKNESVKTGVPEPFRIFRISGRLNPAICPAKVGSGAKQR